MARNAQIRTEFKAKFSEIAGAENLPLIEEWFAPPWEEDNLVVSWISRPQKRVMRVQEADDGETLPFGYAIGKAGAQREYDDVFVQVVSANQKANEILQLYKSWFIELLSPQQMDTVLQSYSDKLQHGC